MSTAPRRYTDKTIKLLFGGSGNQCAHPECTNPIIAPGTPHSEAAVIGQICHIYAAADNGPRGKPGLTVEERNSVDNLILMCGFHHPLVDKQWETYPTETLKAWKKAHEAKYQQRTAEAARLQGSIQQLAFAQTYSDQQIIQELQRIRKGRFLFGFPVKEAALTPATRVESAELAGGSSEMRARALAWCARFLSQGETIARGRELLDKSKALATSEEAQIAEAFIVSASAPDDALLILARITSAPARSAALRIVTNRDAAKGALAWFDRAGLTLDELDPEGKLVYLTHTLSEGQWERAKDTASHISEEDFEDAPALLDAVGKAALMEAIPEEFRALVLTQVPFEVRQFPLAATEAALAARRYAASLFSRISTWAHTMGVAATSNPASDFALWLRLRDPQELQQGLDELRTSLRDPAQSLRRLNLALQFGIELDLAAIEREIDRRVALSGKGTADEAFARFSLAFAQRSPQDAANYIDRHREQLYEHLDKTSLQTVEIELLARAGLVGTANEKLTKACAEGLGEREQKFLRRVIAEAEGMDQASGRKRLFEATGELRDLANLVTFLEDQGSWQELRPFAEQLFSRTRSLEDGIRVARAFNELAEYDRLFDFLSAHSNLVGQSLALQTLWAWSLYREGKFAEASSILDGLSKARDDPNDRALRVNIAIASGNWTDVVPYTTGEWERRAERSGLELLEAGKLAQAVGGPHGRDLTVAATEKSPDDPVVLASAYFHATRAGWEHSQTISDWLTRAAELSSNDGPLKSVSMKELVDQKPAWDKHENDTWRQLNEGKIPVFGAAHLLNRSMLDFVLLQPLANLNQPDVRKRGIVYAFSGARPVGPPPDFEVIALDPAAMITLARLNLLDTVIKAYALLYVPLSTLGWLFQERERATFHQPSRIRDAHLIRQLVATNALRILPSQSSGDDALAGQIGDQLTHLLVAARRRASITGAAPQFVIRSAPVYRVSSLMAEEADLSQYQDLLCGCQAVVAKLRSKGLLTLGDEQRARAYLKLHERPWLSEPIIADGAEIYLDELSVIYLRTIGIIDRLKSAGLTAYITEHEHQEAIRLIDLEGLSDRQLEVVETIRRALSAGFQSGRIRTVKSSDPDQTHLLRMHPSAATLAIQKDVDAIVMDDRCVNQHVQVSVQGRATPILSSLDVLEDLASRGIISQDDHYAYRTRLRQEGFQLIPITEDELLYHLDQAPLADGRCVETAELRAIREAFLKGRMSKTVQIPLEAPWLQGSMNVIVHTIKQLWVRKPAEAAAYGQWLLGLLDLRGWSASAIPGNERVFALHGYASQILQLIFAPTTDSPDITQAYSAWITEALLNDLRHSQPEMFTWIVARAQEFVAHSVDRIVAKLAP